MGETITTTKMASVPLNGRSFTDLLALQAGVVPASSRQPNAVVMSGCTSTAPSGDLNAGNLSVSGQRETNNGFVVNGSTVEEDFSMGTALIPNLDSIQDFRVLTSNFDAEYGNYSGGQIVVTTKSGTNEFHGSGFDFLRNTNLDARNYFSSDRARYDQSQFGGTFGGPIKKEKSFFFVDYQGTRMTEGVETGLISVPASNGADGRPVGYRKLAHRRREWPVLGQLAFAEPWLPGVSRRGVLHSRVRELSAVRLAQRADSAQRLVRPGQELAALYSPAQSGGKYLFDVRIQ